MKATINFRKGLLFVFILTQFSSFGQITINNLTTLTRPQMANALVDSLVGTGVTFSNPVLSGVRLGGTGYQAGYFTTATTTMTQMGFQKGVVLTTGNTSDIPLTLGTNPGSVAQMSKNYTSCTTGEVRQTGTCATTNNDLDVLAGSVNFFNASVLEFDFVPVGDSICFRYVFGSEEYSDQGGSINYQCSSYNDKFGFLISGPGVTGGAGYSSNAKNIARLSNNAEVGINSVNNGVVGSSGGSPSAATCLACNSAWVQGTPTPEYNGHIDGTQLNGNTDPLYAAIGGLTPGATYHIKLIIVDANDGAYDAVVYIEAGSFTSPQPTTTIDASQPTICSGASTWVIVTTNYGTAPYTYTWSNGTVHTTSNSKDSIQVSPTSNTTYTVTVTDNSVPTPMNSVISQNISVVSTNLTPGSPTHVLCYGQSTGAFSVTPSGGNSPYHYSWSHNAGLDSQNATGLPAGTYTVTMTDANSCTATSSITITQPSSALSVVYSSQNNVLCFGLSTGALTASASGGTSTYTYNWSHNGSVHTASVSSLPAGSYTVTVIDANSCTTTLSTTITQPASALSASIPPANVTNIGCFGESTGQLIVNGSGGTGTYTYSWSHNAGLNSNTATGLAAGSYTVTVTDANSCTTTVSSTLSQPSAALNLTAPPAGITHVACHGEATGASTVSASGGTGTIAYSWSHNPALNSATASGLSAGTYSVTITDGNACTATVSLTISEPLAGLGVLTGSTNSTCGNSDGSASLTTNGGTSPYSYYWQSYPDSLNSSLNNIPAGAYLVTITDDNGCTSQTSVTVSDMGAPVVSIVNTANVSCHGLNNGLITVNAIGGTGTLDYTWSNGSPSQNLSNLSGGIYSLTVSDDNNCIATISYEVLEPDTLVAGLSSLPVSCFGQLDGEVIASPLGGSPGYTWNWSDGSTTQNISGLTGGWYFLTLTDAHSCIFNDSIFVAEPDTLDLLFASSPVTCFGQNNGGIDLTTSGGNGSNTYAWSSGDITQDISGLDGGMYLVTVTDSEGCVAVDSIQVTEPALLAIAGSADSVSCYGDSDGAVAVSVTGGNSGYSFNWSNGSSAEDLTNLENGTYSLTVTDQAGCTGTLSVVVDEPDSLILLPTIQNVSCFEQGNGSAILTVQGGILPYDYSWSHNTSLSDSSAMNLGAGNYSVTVTDFNSCSSIHLFTITEPAILSINIDSVSILCFGQTNGSLTASVTGGVAPYSYDWSSGDTTMVAVNLSAGSYTVTITDNNNCTSTELAGLASPASLSASTVIVNATCPGVANGSLDVTASGGIQPYTWSWSEGSSTSLLQNILSGDYNLTISDANGCEDTYTYLVENDASGCLNVPTAFSPNDDGTNDTWQIEHIELYENISIQIFNRWGQLIFSYSGTGYNYGDPENQWDGTYEGKELPISSYIFILDLGEEREVIQGIVTIIK